MANCENCTKKDVCKYYEPKSTVACEHFSEPVRHGRWNTGYFHDRVCSYCLHPDNDINDYAHNYCPNCGAKMDEEVSNDKTRN